MFFDKKKKVSPVDQQQAILASKVRLRKIMDQSTAMLEKELKIARALKAKGMKSASNYSKIGTAFYLQKIAKQAYGRLDDISSTAELNSVMNSLSSALGQVNQIGAQSTKGDSRGMLQGLKKMQNAAARDEGSLAPLLDSVSAAADRQTEAQFSQFADMNTIEALINGGLDALDIPADAVPITNTASPRRNEMESDDLHVASVDIPVENRQEELLYTAGGGMAKGGAGAGESARESSDGLNMDASLDRIQALIDQL